MYLFSIELSGFRGIHSLELRLGATTVLIGENDWGKASLFEILERCLGHSDDGMPSFSSEDLHRDPEGKTGPIQVILSLREDAKGEFDKPEFALLASHSEESDDRRCVRIKLEATPPSDSTEGVAPRIMIGSTEEAVGLEVLQLARRYCPVLVVRPDRGIESIAMDTAEAPSSQQEKIEAQIEEVYNQIVSARRAVKPSELDAAVADVGKLLHEHAMNALSSNPEAGRLLEHLGGIPQHLALGGGPTLPIAKHGSATQAISLLVLVGSILHARGPRALDPAAMPLVVVEEPEAHLHPTLLAGVWSLILGMQTQRLVTTYSGILLASVPLYMLRRIERTSGGSIVHRVRRKTLDTEDRRRIGYHIRALRGHVLFARVWILIEGETEFWILPELARIFGHNLDASGIQLIEFAQCGVAPIAKLANDLGIGWHLLTDGDDAGATYIQQAQQFMEPEQAPRRLLRFDEKDIEHHLWEHGFASVYREAAGRGPKPRKREQPTSVIDAAIRAHSKPDLALRVIERAEQMEQDELPSVLGTFLEEVLATARGEDGPRRAD